MPEALPKHQNFGQNENPNPASPEGAKYHSAARMKSQSFTSNP